MPLLGTAMNARLRDMARFGELMRLGGVLNGDRILPAAAIEEHPPRRQSREVRPSRLQDPSWLELSPLLVGVARRPRRVHGPRHSRPGDLRGSEGRDGHCAVRIAPACRQRQPGSLVASRLPRGRRPSDAAVVVVAGAFVGPAGSGKRRDGRRPDGLVLSHWFSEPVATGSLNQSFRGGMPVRGRSNRHHSHTPGIDSSAASNSNELTEREAR